MYDFDVSLLEIKSEVLPSFPCYTYFFNEQMLLFIIFLPWHIFDIILKYFFNHCLDCSNWNYSQLHWASQPCFLIVWQFFDCLFAACLFSWEPFTVFSKLALMFLVIFCSHYKTNYSMSPSAGGHIRGIFSVSWELFNILSWKFV